MYRGWQERGLKLQNLSVRTLSMTPYTTFAMVWVLALKSRQVPSGLHYLKIIYFPNKMEVLLTLWRVINTQDCWRKFYRLSWSWYFESVWHFDTEFQIFCTFRIASRPYLHCTSRIALYFLLKMIDSALIINIDKFKMI